MPVTSESNVVRFDADAACAAAREAVSGTLRSAVEFNSEAFNPLYVDDLTLAFYEDETEMMAHFERIHSYVNLDLAEVDLFTGELFPIAERVEYITTALDFFKMVRVYYDGEGLFLALDRDEPVTPVVKAISEALENGRYPSDGD